MIVIVGAGLAGLSTAYHLAEIPYRLYEREAEVGGLCRSYRKDGFTFDYTGHLLHFRQPEIKALVERLLAGQLDTHRRSAVILRDAVTSRLRTLVASPALAARVCVDSYGGGCLASTTCWHYDQHGDWIGTVRIDYEC